MTIKFYTTIAIILTAMTLSTALSGESLDRTQRPVGKPAPKVTLPEIQKAKLSNGLQVWLVEHHELPTVALNLVIQAGSDHDPVAQPGLAALTAANIDEGTKKRTALQVSEEIESIGASFGASSSLDGSFLTLTTLTKHLAKALDVYTDVLTNPTFPQKEFERIRKQRLTQLMQQHDQPVAIANIAYARILYGNDHPYGNNAIGTEASLKSLTTDDLINFYHTYYRPNNATLIVVGDVKMEQIIPVLENALSGWTATEVPSFTVPGPRPVDKMRIYLIDKPGAPQSEVRIGYPALARNTPDYFPVLEMNRILGGQFTSRINLNIRERHGYTYGANSGFRFQKGVGPFTAQGAIVTEKTDSALVQFLYELNLMHDKGMTPEELEFVKKGLVGSFALSFETPAQIAGALQNIVLYGLPEDYYQHYLQNIEAVKLDEANKAARQYLVPAQMAVVIVGDLSKIKQSIQALNLADVVLCDLDGKPLP